MKTIVRFSLAASIALALAACQQEAPEAAEAPAPANALTQLPLSTNAAMVGMVDHAADYICDMGNGDMPRDEHDWDLVRGGVYNMILGGAVIQVPGTGANDAQWAANDDWKQWSADLTAIGRDALPMVEARSTDQEAWMDLGNRLVANCEDCHAAYKPDIPTQGILHEATPPETQERSIFD
jgi:hypothetical protein